ncbi:MAG: hypothetical protein F6K31_31255 [Symploca sp. SIO2G7]|nr:hypothetical protein [Symploca sp. SIO2G7]
MAAKKQKDISKEVAKLDAKVQDVSQKALDLAKLAEETKSTFDSQTTAFTAETSQSIEQASHEFQRSIDTNYNEVFEKSQEVYDQLEEKQEGFEKAIAADRSDLTKLNALKQEAEAAGVSSSDIDRAGESKQEEINFLSASTEHIETVQDELKKKLDESRQRRQAARLNYQSKSLDNNTQAVGGRENTNESSKEGGEKSDAVFEAPLESQTEDNSASSEKNTRETTNQSVIVLPGSPPFSKDVIKTFFTETEGERVGNCPISHVIRDHISTGDPLIDIANLRNQFATRTTKRKASMFHNEEIASQAIKEVIDANYADIEIFAKNHNTAPGENTHFQMKTSLSDLGFGIDRNGNPLPQPISKVFVVIKARGDGTWLIQTAFPKN